MISRADTDRAAYLANILAIAGADGQITAAEQSVIRAIAGRIGAGATDMAEAGRRVAERDYAMAILADPASRLSNLEDMLMVGLADGKLDERETSPLEAMATALHFNQMDVDMALRRAQSRLAKLASTPSSAVDTAALKTEPAAPGTVARQPDTAANDAPATTAANQGRPSRFTRRTEPRRQVEHVPAPMLTAPWQRRQKPPESAEEQAEASRTQTAGAPRNGDGTPRAAADFAEAGAGPEPSPAPRHDGASMSIRDECIRARSLAADPEAYCHGLACGDPNAWGCRLAEMPWTAGADWLAYGSFRPDGAFVFDRDAILAMLEERLAIAAGCPHLRTERIERALAALPGRVRAGPRWQHRKVNAPGAGTEVVQHEYVHGCRLTSRFRAECLDPIGQADVRRIIRDSSRETAVVDGMQ